MICVFFRQPVTGIQSPPYASPIETRAATAAAEITNTVEWLMVYST
jgi:hypothetical protein